MIDLSSLRAPGWQRVVADLSTPAPDDRIFTARLLTALCQVAGARQGVVFAVPAPTRDAPAGEPAPEVEPRPMLVWPFTPEQGAAVERGADMPVQESAIEHLPDAKSAARRAAGSRQSQAFGLDNDDLLYDTSGGKGFLLVVPIPGASGAEAAVAPVGAVVTLLLDNRSRQALQTTLALVEILCGYVHAHAANQQLRRTRAAGASLDLAARLIASINNARTFKGACLQLVNDLCRQLAVDRVALGWVSGGSNQHGRLFTRVITVSDTENVDRRMAMIQKIEHAMDECLDQDQPVLYPPPKGDGPGGDVLLSQAIVHAHRELAASDAKLKVATLPLRVDDNVIGVLLVESSSDGPIDLATIELLQASLDLVSPVMQIRRSDDRWLALRAWDSGVKGAAWLVGPKHTLWKLAGALVVAASLVVTFVEITYRVGAPMVIQAREPRTVSVPFSGKIKALGEGVEAGRRVEKGQTLVQMDTTELVLSKLESRAAIVQAEKEAEEARKKNNTGEAQQAEAKARQAQAKLDLKEYQIGTARIEAPISGTIIAGELKDRVGASIELGQALFQLADLSDMIVEIKADDRDIALIREGMTGEIATKAAPEQTFPFTVERIVPLSQAEEGKNAFLVRARLDATAPWFRPGMEGIAKFNTEKHSLAWIGSRRIVDQLRLWLWW